MAFCWAINPSHRPRAALLVEYLLGLHQQPPQPSGFNTLPTSLGGSDGLTSTNIPSLSFLHNSASVGTDLKKMSSHNSSTSLGGGDVKGLTHQFHSQSLFIPSMNAPSNPDMKSFSTQLAPLYSKPVSVIEEESSSSEVGVFTSGVYTTPSDVQDITWNSSTRNNNVTVPTPPPPNKFNSFAAIKVQRPQQPLPKLNNSIIL